MTMSPTNQIGAANLQTDILWLLPNDFIWESPGFSTQNATTDLSWNSGFSFQVLRRHGTHSLLPLTFHWTYHKVFHHTIFIGVSFISEYLCFPYFGAKVTKKSQKEQMPTKRNKEYIMKKLKKLLWEKRF